jgi:hypothetical protein
MDRHEAGDSAGCLAEAVAMLVKCGAVRIGKPTAGDGNGESRDAAAAPVNGPPLLPTDGKVAAEIQRVVGVGATGGGHQSLVPQTRTRTFSVRSYP